ncbi:MAG: lipoyl synthase [Nitrospirota bacterium]
MIHRKPIRKRRKRLPSWFRVEGFHGENFHLVARSINRYRLNTVCKGARCPNIWECWNNKTATFMLLGDICTRGCVFCGVKRGLPAKVDPLESERVADAAAEFGLRHAVITSVTRDDLHDGGAGIFADTILEIRKRVKGCKVEVLIPDFMGDESALKKVWYAMPDILNHNLETVPLLYPLIRPQAIYKRSLDILRRTKEAGIITKTGIILGLGEEITDIKDVMYDLRKIECDILTLGQYLPPGREHHPVMRFYSPEEFEVLKREAEDMGFRHVEAGPLVRSSYHADRYACS